MIINYLQGVRSPATEMLDHYLIINQLWIAPVVETELLGDPELSHSLHEFLEEALYLEIYDGYWERAGKTRAKLKAKKVRAKTADALIAQACIDNDVPLLTSDVDFAPFAKYARVEDGD